MATNLHIHGLIPGCRVALFEIAGEEIKSEIFNERVFWWTITKQIEFKGDALLRVRCGSVAPFLPFESTLVIDNDEISVSAVMVRDSVVITDEALPAASNEFCAAMVMWAKEAFHSKVHLQHNDVVIDGVGIIRCQLGVVLAINQAGAQVRYLWEDPALFDLILEAFNVS